jgi:hypothetical protein
VLDLVRLRSTHPAFAGQFSVPDAPDGELVLAWRHGGATAELRVVLPHGPERATWRVSVDDGVERRSVADVAR